MRSTPQLYLAIVAISFATATSAFAKSDPDGDGLPNSLACRQGEYPTGSHISGPKVCLKNWQWAILRKKQLTVTADGQHIVSVHDNAGWGLNPGNDSGASPVATAPP